ncbi:MAG: methyltransferase domain-containing protein [Bacteroidota bacterium]
MPIFLNNRQPELVEYMDRDDCDPHLLANTYKQFHIINRLLSKWRSIYMREIRPLAKEKNAPLTLLDIGFGGGDIPLQLAKWAKQDNIALHITAIEMDDRAMTFVEQRTIPEHVVFRICSSSDLVKENKRFDIVISNHVIHHLNNADLTSLMQDAEVLSIQKVIFNDIERSDVGFGLFATIASLLFWNSFIVKDGLISIRRSYTFRELRQVAPPGWTVRRLFLYRLLLMWEPNVRFG